MATEDDRQASAEQKEPTRGWTLAARLWAAPKTSGKIVDPEVGEVAAAEFDKLLDRLELAWNIIANAGGGNWLKETADWQEAAACWRSGYFDLLRVLRPPKDSVVVP